MIALVQTAFQSILLRVRDHLAVSRPTKLLVWDPADIQFAFRVLSSRRPGALVEKVDVYQVQQDLSTWMYGDTTDRVEMAEKVAVHLYDLIQQPMIRSRALFFIGKRPQSKALAPAEVIFVAGDDSHDQQDEQDPTEATVIVDDYGEEEPVEADGGGEQDANAQPDADADEVVEVFDSEEFFQ